MEPKIGTKGLSFISKGGSRGGGRRDSSVWLGVAPEMRAVVLCLGFESSPQRPENKQNKLFPGAARGQATAEGRSRGKGPWPVSVALTVAAVSSATGARRSPSQKQCSSKRNVSPQGLRQARGWLAGGSTGVTPEAWPGLCGAADDSAEYKELAGSQVTRPAGSQGTRSRGMRLAAAGLTVDGHLKIGFRA